MNQNFASAKSGLNQKGSILILAFVMMMTAVVITVSYISMVRHDTVLLGGQFDRVRVLYVAEAGLNKAAWYLLNTAPDASTDGSWRTDAYPAAAGSGGNDPHQESFTEGEYTMWVEDAGGAIQITSQADYHGITRVVRQRVDMVLTPFALKYALYAGGSVNLSDTTGTVSGNIASQGSITPSSGLTMTGSSGEDSSVNPLTINVSAYASIADTVINGNQDFVSGIYSGVWYVDGNVTISSGVTFNGSIIATGDVDFSGQSNITITPVSPNPAMISIGDIQADNSSDVIVNGLMYADAEIQMNNADDFTVNGAIVAGGAVTASDMTGLSLGYDPDIFTSPAPFVMDDADSKTLNIIAGSWEVN